MDPLDTPTVFVDAANGVFRATSEEDPSRVVEAVPHLIGIFHPDRRELWPGWSYDDGDEVSHQLRTHGEQHRIPELTGRTVLFPPTPLDPVDWASGAAHQLGEAAVQITGRGPYYVGSNGSSGVTVLLLDPELPPLTVADAIALLPGLLREKAVHDPWAAVQGLARLADWGLSPTGKDGDLAFDAVFARDEGGRPARTDGGIGWGEFRDGPPPRTVTLYDIDNRIKIAFDEHGRISSALPVLARTPSEEFLYMELHRCACGSSGIDVQDPSYSDQDGVFLRRYAWACDECGRGPGVLVPAPVSGRAGPADGRMLAQLDRSTNPPARRSASASSSAVLPISSTESGATIPAGESSRGGVPPYAAGQV
ncbi:DUF6882 domain-containing protein [Micromonospora sp. NBC_01655]|uniref:DUF6882 domain-containing protein n=1 Tax=Micromonospora sp. NBC_01655 TaxID=2975983 RepID=UPI002B1CDE14|nr:DUF6882 domain-containing protein [Micromonospora sp. NBC_01655]